jgi:hypothetical protein
MGEVTTLESLAWLAESVAVTPRVKVTIEAKRDMLFADQLAAYALAYELALRGHPVEVRLVEPAS